MESPCALDAPTLGHTRARSDVSTERPPQTKKRKRDDLPTDCDTFQARRIDSDDAPIAFRLIRRLSRASLPLLWLQMKFDEAGIVPGTLLSIAGPQHETVSVNNDDNVTIARLSPNGGIYALEHVKEDTYIACGLQPFITEDRVLHTERPADLEQEIQLLRAQQQYRSTIDDDWTIPRLPTPFSPKKPKNRRGIAARKSILPTPGRLSEVLTDVEEQSSAAETQDLSQLPTAYTPANIMPLSTVSLTPEPQTAEDSPFDSVAADVVPTDKPPSQGDLMDPAVVTEAPTLDQFHQQYLETLYLSKTSLAYFVKGPLNRFRTATNQSSPSKRLCHLTEHYRGSLLPMKKLDLKFKESVIRVIENTDLTGSAQFGAPGKLGAKKIPKRGKKLGKNGLYSDEAEYVRRWWQRQDLGYGAATSAGDMEKRMRAAISDLRNRESMLQILLVLEIIALDSQKQDQPEETPFKLESQEQGANTRTPVKKSQRKHDLQIDLDPLLDRLCIWQTLGMDGLLESPEKPQDSSTTAAGGAKDKLRDFCTDVVLPFYTSRTPETCKLVCKRLGGPGMSFKEKTTAAPKTSGRRPVPGASLLKKPHPKPKRTLERVLSEDMGSRHASPPVLSRSNSISLQPSIKREPIDNGQRPGSRGNIRKSVSFSNREVDLVGVAKTQEAKKKRLTQLAVQKQELAAAIEALKKPNRGKAAQTLMEDSERRASDKPTSSTSRQSLQIISTPKRGQTLGRVKNAASPSMPSIEITVDDPLVPSSTIRTGAILPGFHMTETPAKKRRAVLHTIENTPSRPKSNSLLAVGSSPLPGKSSGRAAADPIVMATPAASRSRTLMSGEGVHATPPTDRVSLSKRKPHRPMLFTSLQKAEVGIESAFRDAPLVTEKVVMAMDRVMRAAPSSKPGGQHSGRGGGIGGQEEGSIYDCLGWNDDDEAT